MMRSPRMRLAAFLVLSVIASAGGAAAQTPARIAAGAPPGPLMVDEWLQAGTPPSWETLRGKVVVLDLWGTWCSPCVAEIPAWNKLVDTFAGRDVAFVSIAIDDRDRLVEFLEDHPVKGLIGRDTDRRTHKSYGIPGVGYWVVVGKDGNVVAVTEPKNVTEAALARLLADEKLELPGVVTEAANLKWDRELIEWRDGIEPMTQVIIKPVATRTGGQMYRPGSNRFSADGAGLQPLLVFAYDIEFEQVDVRLSNLTSLYRVSALVPPGQEARLRPMLQEALKATLGFQVRWEDREKDVYILRKADGVEPTWRSRDDEEPTSMASGRQMVGRRQPVSTLRSQLTMVLGRLVFDESGLTGLGSWDMEVREDKPDVIIGQVRQQLGLRVEAARRKVPVLVVEPGK